MGRWDGYQRPLCKAPGCERFTRSHGYCGMHRMRLKQRGELEPANMRTATGLPSRFIQEAISSATTECILWPFAKQINGYGIIRVDGRTLRAHNLVCRSSHGEPPARTECAHSCGRRSCINPRHLRWASREENQDERVAHGTSNRGVRQWNAKLNSDKVRKIRRDAEQKNLSQQELANGYGVGRKTISDILTGKTWGWLD